MPAAAYVVTNWLVSDLPGERVGRLPAPDWLLHGMANALFGAALRWPLAGRRRPRRTVLAATILALHGALDEWHQGWVPGRTPSLTDWAADVAGGLIGWFIARRGWPTKRGRPLPRPGG